MEEVERVGERGGGVQNGIIHNGLIRGTLFVNDALALPTE